MEAPIRNGGTRAELWTVATVLGLVMVMLATSGPTLGSSSAVPPHAAGTVAGAADPPSSSFARVLLSKELSPLSVPRLCAAAIGGSGCSLGPHLSVSGEPRSIAWLNESAREEANLLSALATSGGIADDPSDGYVVRFGGAAGSFTLADTW